MLPSFWPLFNVINIITLPASVSNDPPSSHDQKNINDSKPEDEEPETGHRQDSYGYMTELIGRNLRLFTYWSVAYLTMLYTFPSYAELTDQSDNLSKFMMKWACIVCVRDIFVLGFFCYMWHWMLFDSPWAYKMKPLKYNPVYPPQSQWDRDKVYTLCTSLVVSGFELINIYLLKTNPWMVYESFFGSVGHTLSGIAWLLATPYIVDAHFYWFHRMQHPWKWKLFGLFDPGYYLYIYVHKPHHVDKNVGVWSALSAHPVEAVLDFNAMLIPVIFFYFRVHPMHILFDKWYSVLSPIPNHDGFDSPGGGSYYHYLHHAYFECNYGSPMVPFDAWFGSFEDGKKYQTGGKHKKKKKDS